MIPLLKDLTEPVVIGTSLFDLELVHRWYLGDNGWWHCECDGDAWDTSWEEVVDDVGANSTNYILEVPQ